MWVNEKPNSNHGRSSFILDAVIMWINEKPNWIHYDFLSLWKLVIGGFQEPWQIQQPRRWRFWPWRFNVPATIPSLSLETPGRWGEVGCGMVWWGLFALPEESPQVIQQKKMGGGDTVSGKKLNKSNIPKKTGKLENDLETWGGIYQSPRRGKNVWRYLVCSATTWKGTLEVRLPIAFG